MDMMDFIAIPGFAITCFSLGVVYGKDHRDKKLPPQTLASLSGYT